MDVPTKAVELTDAQIANAQTALQHGDAGFRVHSIYWLALCNDGMTLPDELRDDFDAECWKQAFGEEMPAYVNDGESLAGELIDRRRFGFLGRVDVPLPRTATASGYSTCGYGYYAMRWVYAESTDELLQKAVATRDQVLADALKKLRAATPAGEL